MNKSLLDRLILLIANNMMYTLIIYLVSVLFGAWLFSMVENRTYTDSYYWAVTTALTIGFGDITPSTLAGKVVFVIFSHLWILFLVPCIIANIVTRILLNENEFTHDEQELIKQQLQILIEKVDRISKKG